MEIFCRYCGTRFSANICSQCGYERESTEHTTTETSPDQPSATPKSSAPSTLRSTKVLRVLLPIAGLTLLVSLLYFALLQMPGLIRPLTLDEMPTYESAFPKSDLREQTNIICTQLQPIIPSKEILLTYQFRIQKVEGIGFNRPRAMLAFYEKTSWLVREQKLRNFELDWNSVLQRNLSEIVNEYDLRGIDDSNRSKLKLKWEDDYRRYTDEACGLSSEKYSAEIVLSNYDSTLDRAVNVAEKAPWYPVGYYEVSDDLAVKWVTHSGSAPCRDCIYWKINIVSQYGCPQGVYAEINILRDGQVINWSNDSLPSLRPSQVGLLTFEKYSLSGSGSSYRAELSDTSCY